MKAAKIVLAGVAMLSQGNTIGGNLQAFKNEGGLRVFSNRIDGNWQCKENRPQRQWQHGAGQLKRISALGSKGCVL